MGFMLGGTKVGKTIMVRKDPGSVDKLVPEYIGGTMSEFIDYTGELSTVNASAFSGFSSLSNVILNGTNTIGSYAFSGCSSLEKVQLSICNKIDNYAFYRCYSLNEIKGTENITYIGSSAFQQCSNLSIFNITSKISYIGSSAFQSCYKLEGTVDLRGLSVINSGAFSACSNISNVLFGSMVSDPGYFTFCGCSNLYSLNLPSNITQIGSGAFVNCKGLQNVNLSYVTSNIYGQAFKGCDLRVIDIGENLKSISWAAFAENYNTSIINFNAKSLYLSCGIYSSQSGSNMAFGYVGQSRSNGCVLNVGSNCSGITGSLFQYANITKINYNAPSVAFYNSCFYKCENIKEVHITDVNKWASGYFSGVYATPFYSRMGCLYVNGSVLSSANIGSNFSSIRAYTFTGCDKLETVNLSSNIILISSYAFAYCASLRSINLNYITSMGASAFYKCTSLKSISLPEGFTSIPLYAFGACYNLKSINLPTTVTTIGQYAFEDCNQLETVTIPATVASIEYGAFQNCNKVVAVYDLRATPISTASAIGLDSSVAVYTSTATHSGIYSSNNYKVYYDSSSSTYKWYGYEGTSTTLAFPNSITVNGTTVSPSSIYKWAFAYQNQFNKISIPSTITKLEQYAFVGMGNVSSIHYDGNISYVGYITPFANVGSNVGSCYLSTGPNASMLADGLFARASITEAYLTSNITMISGSAFGSCARLSSIRIPNTTSYISTSAFAGCTNLKNITIEAGNPYYSAYYTNLVDNQTNTLLKGFNSSIPSTLKVIGQEAFDSCENLTEITIPDSVTSIGSYAFWNCPNLERVVLGSGVQTLNRFAFGSCSALQEVDFTKASNLTLLGDSVFSSCYSITNFDMMKCTKLSSIASYAFYRLSMQNVSLNGTNLQIGSYAFGSCSNLETITLSGTISNIYYGAFSSCRYVTEINIDATFASTSLPSSIFYSVGYMAGTTTVNIGSPTIPTYLFASCTAIDRINMKSTVTNICSSAFYNCYSASIYFDKHTFVPTLSASNAFYNTKSIYVPASLYASWIAATNWANISTKIASI